MHWTPITWQGWAVAAVSMAALCAGLSLYRSPALLAWVECGLVALLLVVAARTDDRGRRGLS